MNKLYTFPNCSKCSEVKKLLEEKGIKYNEVNTGIGSGRNEFNEFYKKNKDRIERDNGGIILPIFVSDSEILQGLEKIAEVG